jgi:hypothetical protein
LTEQAAEKRIFQNEDEVAAGYNLGKLQEMCMIGRTCLSKINGQSIGSALPGLIRRHVDLEFKGVQIARYENASRLPLKKLVYWKSRDNMLYEILEILHAAAPDFKMPARGDHIKQIRIVCQQSPKMCAIPAFGCGRGSKARRENGSGV